MDVNYNQLSIDDLYFQLSEKQKRVKDIERYIEETESVYNTLMKTLNETLNRPIRNPSKKTDLTLKMDELYEQLKIQDSIDDLNHFKSELNKKNNEITTIKTEIKKLETAQKTPISYEITGSGSGSSLDLDKLKKYALSDGDIEELLGEDIFICVYPYLNEVEHIDEIFDDKGRCMLLFNTINDSAGHWVCMHKKKDRIDFFDPYGLKPDEPMKWLTEEKRDDLDMETRRLTQLLKSSGYKVYYNTFEFQSDKHSNTCGRWCASRLLYLNYDLDQFYQFINHYKNKYELGTLENAVTYLTYEIINK